MKTKFKNAREAFVYFYNEINDPMALLFLEILKLCLT